MGITLVIMPLFRFACVGHNHTNMSTPWPVWHRLNRLLLHLARKLLTVVVPHQRLCLFARHPSMVNTSCAESFLLRPQSGREAGRQLAGGGAPSDDAGQSHV
jgi:hypothetical protein